MYRHVVLFRFRPELPSETKQKAANEFKEGILNLKGIIPQIRSIEVGFNVNASEKWDICLMGNFDTLEDIRKYSTSPQHLKVAGALKPFLDGRACTDYVAD